MKTEEEIRATEQRLAKTLSELLSEYARSERNASFKKIPRKVLFEDGMLCGKISALRWVIEAEWAFFYKSKEL